MKYLMSLDQGTTSSRCIIFDEKTNIVATAQKEYKQLFPKEGWVEHDPYDILASQLEVAKEALRTSNIPPSEISGIGITNQRETTIVWNKDTGKPYYNAIVWQCRRTTDFCAKLKADGYEPMIKERTGLLIDPYFSATKIKWILDHVPGVRQDAEQGKAIFGTVDTWLIWNLSGGKCHATDVSNASRTMIFNINTMTWDKELLKILDIPHKMLPQVVDSSSVICKTAKNVFGAPIRICGIAGDQQAALFGHGCFTPGECKNTYGTGCFLLMNTGEAKIDSKFGLLSSVAWRIGGKTAYALEGSVFVAGAAIQWLRDEMKLIDTAAQSEAAALSVPNSGGVYIVPAFTGLGAPYWQPEARGVICGLTRGTNKNHIIRATLESLAYQTNDVLSAMINDSGIKIHALDADGGATANKFLMQFQADISAVNIKLPVCREATALGAALLAGLACGVYKNLDEIKAILKTDAEFTPKTEDEIRGKLLRGWKNAIEKCKI